MHMQILFTVQCSGSFGMIDNIHPMEVNACDNDKSGWHCGDLKDTSTGEFI